MEQNQDNELGRSPADAGSGCQPTASAAEGASSLSGIPNAVVAPILDALADFEGECFFGCLGSSEAGAWYPDETRFALVHIVDNRMHFSGPQTMDDAPEGEGGDIGSFTLGDLRRLKAAAQPTGDLG